MKRLHDHFQAAELALRAFLFLCPHTLSSFTRTARQSEAPALTNIDGPASFHGKLPRLWRQAEGKEFRPHPKVFMHSI